MLCNVVISAKAEGLLKQCVAANPNLQLGPVLGFVWGLPGPGKAVKTWFGRPRKGITRFPTERRFYLTVANHAGRIGRYERALEVFGEAHRRWPQDAQFKDGLASAYLYYGMQQLDKAQNEEAERHLRQAVILAEHDVDARLNLGRALHNLNRSVEAEREFDRVIALNPKAPLARFHRGMVRQALGDLDAAITDLSEEIRQNPAYPPSYFSRGKAYQTKGLLTEALGDLDMAAEKMPDNARVSSREGAASSNSDRSRLRNLTSARRWCWSPRIPNLLTLWPNCSGGREERKKRSCYFSRDVKRDEPPVPLNLVRSALRAQRSPGRMTNEKCPLTNDQ